ncbi:hypothetical protein EJ08DRAFT_341803 [Tothia fuscella]|uniref:Uncharacterized protein n=1 Tax=Tothia fuscella TaxID=1048955 RepID=A0A9P4P241_9PEZI|nr:hypothetical protein EJ08DRAFT_341803 [Tothia fuscella]
MVCDALYDLCFMLFLLFINQKAPGSKRVGLLACIKSNADRRRRHVLDGNSLGSVSSAERCGSRVYRNAIILLKLISRAFFYILCTCTVSPRLFLPSHRPQVPFRVSSLNVFTDQKQHPFDTLLLPMYLRPQCFYLIIKPSGKKCRAMSNRNYIHPSNVWPNCSDPTQRDLYRKTGRRTPLSASQQSTTAKNTTKQ